MQLIEQVVSIVILLRCCIRGLTYIDAEEGWCQGRTLRDSIVNSSRAADLTVASSQSEASVGEKFHYKRYHNAGYVACAGASVGDHVTKQYRLPQ